MQQTNPSMLPEPGINDDLVVFGRTKCSSDDERYYDPQCFSYEGMDIIENFKNPAKLS